MNEWKGNGRLVTRRNFEKREKNLKGYVLEDLAPRRNIEIDTNRTENKRTFSKYISMTDVEQRRNE
jgi:hypothetical protein